MYKPAVPALSCLSGRSACRPVPCKALGSAGEPSKPRHRIRWFVQEPAMATMSDVSIINWNKAQARPVESGLERTICSPSLCGSKFLTVYHRTVSQGRRLDVQAGGDYHLVYVIEAPKAGVISFNGKSHAARSEEHTSELQSLR